MGLFVECANLEWMFVFLKLLPVFSITHYVLYYYFGWAKITRLSEFRFNAALIICFNESFVFFFFFLFFFLFLSFQILWVLKLVRYSNDSFIFHTKFPLELRSTFNEFCVLMLINTFSTVFWTMLNGTIKITIDKWQIWRLPEFYSLRERRESHWICAYGWNVILPKMKALKKKLKWRNEHLYWARFLLQIR